MSPHYLEIFLDIISPWGSFERGLSGISQGGEGERENYGEN